MRTTSKSALTIALAFSGLIYNANAQAVDLIGAFELAKNNDHKYQAAKA